MITALPATSPPAAQPMPPGDLGELLSAFNDATARLQVAHESLHAEVARLKTELRDANEQLERSRRLAALGEMAAGIAHEVRNPLGSIRLYARMLEQDLAGRPEERKLAEKIGSAVRGLDAVVCDVLNFAREMPIRPTPVVAGAILRGAVEEVLADERLCRKGCGIEVLPIDDACDRIRFECDEQLVHRALVNVIRNAVEAMLISDARPSEPRASREPRLSVGAAMGDPAQGVVLFVRDTGPGIPPEAMERIFNPFFTTRATGTGLGLAIVHRIVDAHGGRTRVRNLPGDAPDAAPCGAEVELVFPPPATRQRDAHRDESMPRVEIRAGLKVGSKSLHTHVMEDVR